MKRFLAIVFALTLVICCFAACGKNDKNDGKETDTNDTSAYYETQGDVEVEGGTLEIQTSVEDTTLYVSVVMKDNPGIAGFTMNLEYDNTKCVAREITASDMLNYEEITTNIQQYEDDQEGRAKLTFASMFWANPTDITGDGVLFTLAFDIVDTSAEDFGLEIDASNAAFSNQNFESVLFTIK